MKIKQFYVINCSDNVLSLSKLSSYHRSLPILWHNQGIYVLIPKPVIKNHLDYIDSCKKEKSKIQPSLVYWGDCYPVDSTIGKLLS